MSPPSSASSSGPEPCNSNVTVRVKYDDAQNVTTYSPIVPYGERFLWTAQLPDELLGHAEFQSLDLQLEGGATQKIYFMEKGGGFWEDRGAGCSVEWVSRISVKLIVSNKNTTTSELMLHVTPEFKVGRKTFRATDPQIVLPPNKKPGG